jgi:5S rRNA maturation endonuclease (ribonuclease M5)
MDADRIEELFKILECTELRYRGEWLNASCPFAPWRHKKGTDKKPSFGVSIVPGGTSRCTCFSCGLSSNLHTMVWRLRQVKKGGGWYEQASKLLMTHEHPSLEEIEERISFSDNRENVSLTERFAKAPVGWAGVTQVQQPKTSHIQGGRKVLKVDQLEYDKIPEKHLRSFQPLAGEALDYLTGPRRKMSRSTLALWELSWQSYKRRIVIPVRDWDGNLVAITGRCLDKYDPEKDKWCPEQEPKFLHSKGFKRDYFLFGEHLVQRGETGILVEGHFDAMYLRQMGYPNAVAVMGSHLSQVQTEKVLTMFSDVIIFPDGDEAGGHAAEKWEYALKGRTDVRVLTVHTDRDPDDYDEEELEELMGFDYQVPTW